MSQAKIKTSVLMYLDRNHEQRYEIPQWFPSNSKNGGSQADKHWPPKHVSYDESTETIIASYLVLIRTAYLSIRISELNSFSLFDY